jgi:glycosyltransferase involved in cell wall biosynthesis
MKQFLKQKYGLNSKKIGIWTSGVSLEHFRPATLPDRKKHELRAKLNLHNKFIIMYHGILTPNRGLQQVISALYLLPDYLNDIIFLVIGDGPARSVLIEAVEQYNVHQNVKLMGSVSYEEIP